MKSTTIIREQRGCLADDLLACGKKDKVVQVQEPLNVPVESWLHHIA